MKLELKHVAGYLPYGITGELQADSQEYFSDLIELIEDEDKFKKNSVWKFSGYVDGDLMVPLGEGEIDGFLMSHSNTYACFSGVCKVKPILHPLSDLIKEIEVNGEKIIPLVYILKEFSIFDLSEQEFEYGKEDNEYWVNAVKLRNRVRDSLIFDGNCFSILYPEEGWHVLKNQHEVFELLNKYHFDWKYNLIEKGLAVDINTFKL